MNTIKVQRPFGTLTITENEINQLLDNLPMLHSILLMHAEGSDTFENEWEVSFPKHEANSFLKQYFLENTNYCKQYLSKVFK